MGVVEREVQQFLDAIADKDVYCDGIVISFHPFSGGQITNKPNCKVCDQCALFRSPRITRTLKKWNGRGDPEKGCQPYEFWQIEKRRQEEDSREWVVTMHGHTRTVNGRSPEIAAIRMWFLLREDSVEVPKEVLLFKEYSVREV